jgi:hypothetical protein
MLADQYCSMKTNPGAVRRGIGATYRPILSITLESRHKEGTAMKDPIKKKIDLGRCGAVTLHVSADRKRLLLEFETEPEGFDKSGLNTFIDSLKKIRDRMER